MTDDEYREGMRRELEKTLVETRRRVETLEAMLANWDEEVMGVSDALFQAQEDINDYLVSWPKGYEFIRARLDKLLAEMEAVRKILDTPPSNDEQSAA